jgi:hypothetical protein
MHMTDLLAPFAAGWGRRVRTELDVVPHPFDAARQFVGGPDPDRVLVLGNGPAIGFGVLAQELALPGHLARRLALLTGRGASVDVAARRGTTAATAPALLADVRVAQYDAVVVCIGSSDAYDLLPAERWRSDLGQLVDALRAATSPTTVIAVLGIRPLQRPNAALGRAGALVDGHARRLDALARDVCGRRDGVVHIAVDALLTEAPTGSTGYEALATGIAQVLAQHLDRVVGASAGSGARSLRELPDPEPERQRALDRTGLAVRGSNPRLDHLLRSARELFGTAGAAVTLVDGDRVLFKAAVGLHDRDMPRTVSPCDRTIRRYGAHVLGDLKGEPVAAYGWRFYAGHPLESPTGYRIGALCLLDTRPHEPLTVDRIALAEVAARIEAELWTEAGRPVAQDHRDAADDPRTPGHLTTA